MIDLIEKNEVVQFKDDNFVCPHRLQKGISEARVGYWVVRKLLNMVELKK